MQKGSLTIGDILLNYGGGFNWSSNSAGLMLECADSTEIAVHDSANRVASLMYYVGNTIVIGRNAGWNAIDLVTIRSGLDIRGPLTTDFWRLTNESDYCRLYNANGTAYFRFAARELWSETSLQVNTTANIVGVLTMGNGINFRTNVWNTSTDTINRFYFANNGTTFYQALGSINSSVLHDFRDNSGNSMMVIYNGGTFGMRVYGQITAGFYTIANTNRDLVGVNIENTQVNNFNQTTLYVIQGTFTGFHRCFTEDELFDKNEPQLFKDNYEGRIVISTEKNSN